MHMVIGIYKKNHIRKFLVIIQALLLIIIQFPNYLITLQMLPEIYSHKYLAVKSVIPHKSGCCKPFAAPNILKHSNVKSNLLF
jgi:hypothetical protein